MNKELYFNYSWKYKKEDLKFCPKCSDKFILEDLHIKNQPQLICHNCKFIFYLDSKLVVSAFITNKEKNKVLLLRRAEEPQVGLWGFAGGYVERGNDIFETIKKEIFEETSLNVQINKIIKTFSNPKEGTIELVFEAISEKETVNTNIESIEGKFFNLNSIPFEEVAFESTKEILNLYQKYINKE